jgi:hypothetical protein
MPIHLDGVLVHAMSGSELSRVRTKLDPLRIFPTVPPHPVHANRESSRHGHLGYVPLPPHGQVHIASSPDRIRPPAAMPRVPAGRQAEYTEVHGHEAKPTPRLGIIYLVGDKLLIDSTPVAQAGTYGDCLLHERDHCQYWAQLVRSGDVADAEYEEHPRGRVSYNEKTGKYTLLADRCILGRKRLVRKILSGMNLPVRGSNSLGKVLLS